MIPGYIGSGGHGQTASHRLVQLMPLQSSDSSHALLWTCSHVQQSAGDMLPCGGGVVLQLMASPVHLRGLGWSPPPPDNQLLLRSESRSVTGPTHVQQWALVLPKVPSESS